MIVNVTALTLYFASSIPTPFHVLATLIVVNVINSMACRVFRDIKFGRIPGNASTALPITTLAFRAGSRSRGHRSGGEIVSRTQNDPEVANQRDISVDTRSKVFSLHDDK